MEAIALAFRTARENAPNLPLLYNDYMGWEAASDGHRTAVLKFLETMKGRGIPIDGLGIQSHLSLTEAGAGPTPAEQRAWRSFLDDVVGMGLTLTITEMDINDGKFAGSFAQRDRAVADYAKAYLDLTLSYSQVDMVMFWGMQDKYSWLQNFKPRGDGTLKRACPYDEYGRSKPLRDAVAAALRTAPAR